MQVYYTLYTNHNLYTFCRSTETEIQQKQIWFNEDGNNMALSSRQICDNYIIILTKSQNSQMETKHFRVKVNMKTITNEQNNSPLKIYIF